MSLYKYSRILQSGHFTYNGTILAFPRDTKEINRLADQNTQLRIAFEEIQPSSSSNVLPSVAAIYTETATVSPSSYQFTINNVIGTLRLNAEYYVYFHIINNAAESSGVDAGPGITQSGNTISANLGANQGVIFRTNALALNLSASDIQGVLAVPDGGCGVVSHTLDKVLIGKGVNPIDSSKSAPSGEFVGTTDTQTLTNKTITDPSNNIAASSLLLSNDSHINIVANPPVVGDVLIAHNATTASWQPARWHSTGSLILTAPYLCDIVTMGDPVTYAPPVANTFVGSVGEDFEIPNTNPGELKFISTTEKIFMLGWALHIKTTNPGGSDTVKITMNVNGTPMNGGLSVSFTTVNNTQYTTCANPLTGTALFTNNVITLSIANLTSNYDLEVDYPSTFGGFSYIVL